MGWMEEEKRIGLVENQPSALYICKQLPMSPMAVKRPQRCHVGRPPKRGCMLCAGSQGKWIPRGAVADGAQGIELLAESK